MYNIVPDRCYNCNQFGHMSNNCPIQNGYICYKHEHTAKDCQ
jgi:hypothetical protein